MIVLRQNRVLQLNFYIALGSVLFFLIGTIYLAQRSLALEPLNPPFFEDTNVKIGSFGANDLDCVEENCMIRIVFTKEDEISAALTLKKYPFEKSFSVKSVAVYYSGSVAGNSKHVRVGITSNCSYEPAFYIVEINRQLEGLLDRANFDMLLSSVFVKDCSREEKLLKTYLLRENKK